MSINVTLTFHLAVQPQLQPRVRRPTRCCAADAGASTAGTRPAALSRRQSLALSLAALSLQTSRQALAAPSFEAGDGADVSAYLPDAPGQPGFVRFVPGPSKTPALRSGTIDPAAPYTFNLPKDGRFKEAKVANAISGNYCQPRCDEPTTEVIFQSGKEGKVSVIISPLTKVTRLVNPQISDVLTLEGGANSFGPAITGDSFDAADDLVSSSSTTIDGQVYYSYEMAGPHIAGEHLLASLTFKGGVSVLCVAAASEKQWAQAEANLRQIVASFRIGIPA